MNYILQMERENMNTAKHVEEKNQLLINQIAKNI